MTQQTQYYDAVQALNYLTTGPLGYSIVATQNVSVGGSSTNSTSLNSATRNVRLVSNTDCYIAIGASPTATTSSLFLPSGSVEYFQVRGGEVVAVIQSAAGGTLNLAEMAR